MGAVAPLGKAPNCHCLVPLKKSIAFHPLAAYLHSASFHFMQQKRNLNLVQSEAIEVLYRLKSSGRLDQ